MQTYLAYLYLLMVVVALVAVLLYRCWLRRDMKRRLAAIKAASAAIQKIAEESIER